MQKQKEERRRKQQESKQAAQRDRELKKQRLQVKLCNVCPHTCMCVCTDIRMYVYSTYVYIYTYIHNYYMVHSVHTYTYIQYTVHIPVHTIPEYRTEYIHEYLRTRTCFLIYVCTCVFPTVCVSHVFDTLV